jgi:hypothetical protein
MIPAGRRTISDGTDKIDRMVSEPLAGSCPVAPGDSQALRLRASPFARRSVSAASVERLITYRAERILDPW